MRDQDLRELERAAASGGTDARLAWAGALERMGRVEEALEALVPARDDATARAAIVRLAEERKPRPIRRPRLKWKRPVLLIRERGVREHVLVSDAHPLGLLVNSFWPSARTLVFNADNGAEIRETREPLVGRVADVILTRPDRTLVARDIYTGQELYRIPHERNLRSGTLISGGLFIYDESSRRGLVADSIVDARTPPRNRWVIDRSAEVYGIGFDLEGYRYHDLDPSSRMLFLMEGNGTVVAVERESGRVEWTGPGDHRALSLWGDGGGCVLRSRESHRTVAFDTTGRELWSREFDLWIFAVFEHIVLGRSPDRCLALDRQTGAVLFEIPAMHVLARAGDSFVAYDRGGPALRAYGPRGEELWSLPAPEIVDSAITSLVPMGARLYGATESGEVFCLEDAS